MLIINLSRDTLGENQYSSVQLNSSWQKLQQDKWHLHAWLGGIGWSLEREQRLKKYFKPAILVIYTRWLTCKLIVAYISSLYY